MDFIVVDDGGDDSVDDLHLLSAPLAAAELVGGTNSNPAGRVAPVFLSCR